MVEESSWNLDSTDFSIVSGWSILRVDRYCDYNWMESYEDIFTSSLFYLLFIWPLVCFFYVFLWIYRINSLFINLKILLISLKFSMMIIIFTSSWSLFAEPVHVELADIGCEIGMLEVEWQNGRSKFINISDDKSNAIMMPVHNILILFILLKAIKTSNISYVLRRNADFLCTCFIFYISIDFVRILL